MASELEHKTREPFRRRFYFEFVLICLVVSLGAVEAYSIGFYRFRLVDLILMLSSLYCFRLLVMGKLNRKAAWLIFLYVLVMVVRTFVELDTSSGTEFMRTLFGMTAAYLTPLIFFVVRESYIDYRIAMRLLVIAWIVSLLSQMGLLVWGESYVSGAVNIASLLGLQRRDGTISLDYMETTITIWRALSVGVTFAVLLAKTRPWMKMLGVIGLLLQYAGGGGGRSALLFVFFLPIIFYSLQGSLNKAVRLRKLLWAGAVGVAFVGLYLWAPIGGSDPVKSGGSHFERSTEIFVPFTEGWRGADARGGFETRTLVYEQYVEAIFSDPVVFLFGTGLSKGAAFEWTNLSGLAHNIILDVWGLTGLVGLLFFVMFVGYVISDLRSLLRATPEGTVEQIISFSYAGAVLFMIQYMLVQATTADRSFMVVFFLTSGLLQPITRWIKNNTVHSVRIVS